MLILLSDGSGLTARQCATVLDRAGHRVEVLSSGGLCLARMTGHVRRVHQPASTWCGPWSRWPARARRGRSRRDGRVSGRISCCWRSWARPSMAGAAASHASCGTGGSTGAYSLTPAAWEELRRAAATVGPGLPGD